MKDGKSREERDVDGKKKRRVELGAFKLPRGKSLNSNHWANVFRLLSLYFVCLSLCYLG
ncbi:hypothetical protein PDIG_12420 [Penicillium digitatum PHI26]|uniref:Uncharacterized protein n=2 Tax=Penicillium digitatum TaxID=36651 RepID=K9G959_PEND2|nr:hypothetical protein PDIP_38640 [Penicillium digitatum Pd1]EKV15789.1 hypothetical protein PDIP_38640 [Penicillium digitatum Pd1]EKV17854.1 hypothetical protein PDIG_12420 [Penicillium digitatum PHI26]